MFDPFCVEEEIISKLRIECSFCDDEIVEEEHELYVDVSDFRVERVKFFDGFAKERYKKGWREVSSKKYEMQGMCCPACMMNAHEFVDEIIKYEPEVEQ